MDDVIEERLLDGNEVSRRLCVHPDTLREMRRDGRFIAPFQIGKLVRWREADVNAWIASRGVAQDAIEAAVEETTAPRKRRRS